MANEAEKKQLVTKVKNLVNTKFEGSYKNAFAHYDQIVVKKRDGLVDKTSLVKLLDDAGVGNGFTRGAWASAVIAELDTDKDSQISWAEFESVFDATKRPPSPSP